MDLQSLEIFAAVVREGGVVRAAQALHRVPSSVTTRLRLLEEDLGVNLFVRQGRQWTLTEHGQILLEYTQRLLRLSDEALMALQRAQSVFRVGSLESTAATRLADVLSHYHVSFPNIRVEIVVGTTDALTQQVVQGKLDAAFVSEPFVPLGLNQRKVFLEQLMLITPAHIRRPDELPDSGCDTMIAFVQGCSYRKRLQEWMQQERMAPARTLEFASYQGMLACVAAGTGFCIMPRSVVRMLRLNKKVRAHELPAPLSINHTHLIWRDAPSTALQHLLELLPEVSGGV